MGDAGANHHIVEIDFEMSVRKGKVKRDCSMRDDRPLVRLIFIRTI
jgi:hypothetical protein